jgi:hypothetical protein
VLQEWTCGSGWLLKAAFQAGMRAWASQQAIAGHARQLLQPSLALLQHLTCRQRLLRDAADIGTQLQTYRVLQRASAWIEILIEPVRWSSGDNNSSSTGGGGSSNSDVLTNFASAGPALDAVTATYQAGAELCQVERRAYRCHPQKGRAERRIRTRAGESIS